MPDGHDYRDLNRYAEATRLPQLRIIRIDASFCFCNAVYLRNQIARMTRENGIRAVIIDFTSVNDLDSTAYGVLERVAEQLKEKNMHLVFAGMKGPVRDILKRGGLPGIIGQQNLHLTVHKAVQHLRHRTDLLPECHDGAGI